MSKARKTHEVSDLLRTVNGRLALPDSVLSKDGTAAEARAYRMAISGLLETVLFDTGNYKGFGYQTTETDGEGSLKDKYDDTRRRYF